ncbi:hypothetical protein HanIR_Chr15g0775951 [Helianthus annuus]|nr:hypothetical protein HanIR_Chr15g0775951 [Helianthus annuus]
MVWISAFGWTLGWVIFLSWKDGVTPRFPRVSPVGPVGDYRDVVGNNIVKPHNI